MLYICFGAREDVLYRKENNSTFTPAQKYKESEEEQEGDFKVQPSSRSNPHNRTPKTTHDLVHHRSGQSNPTAPGDGASFKDNCRKSWSNFGEAEVSDGTF